MVQCFKPIENTIPERGRKLFHYPFFATSFTIENTIPERGRKFFMRSGIARKPERLKTQSPRGDGNDDDVVYKLMYNMKRLKTQSPRGDGNATVRATAFIALTMRLKTQSPRGDGNKRAFARFSSMSR